MVAVAVCATMSARAPTRHSGGPTVGASRVVGVAGDTIGGMDTPNGSPKLTLAGAAKATGISESTLRRKRPELIEAGAKQTKQGWQIPVTALISLGLMPNTTAAPDPVPMVAPDVVEELRAKLADAEQRAAVAEARAEERERLISAQAATLRILEAAPRPAVVVEPVHVAPEPVATAPTEKPKRRRWFS